MGCPKEERVMIDFLHNFKEELLVTEHVMYPTHKHGNALDLVFTNNSQLIHNYLNENNFRLDQFSHGLIFADFADFKPIRENLSTRNV